MKKYFGVDIGGTTVKMGYFQVDGVLLDKWEIPTRKHMAEDVIIVVYGNTAAFLSAVLKCVKSVIHHSCTVVAVSVINAEKATFFFKFTACTCHSYPPLII